jgi:putative peptidoglycan lipid II flippase
MSESPPASGSQVTGGGDAGGLVRTSTVMAVGTVFSRVLGFGNKAVQGAALGGALTASTFNVANTVPNMIYILLAGGVLNAVFVPQLVRAMKEHPEGGRAYTDRLLTLSGLVLLAITVVATLCAPLVIGLVTSARWSDGDVSVAVAFAFWCLPQIFFYGLYSLLGQVLNARGSFGPMMWAPIVNNLVAITTGLAFIALFTADVDVTRPSSLSGAAIAFLGFGTTLGVALQALVLIPVLRRTGFRYRPRFDYRGHGLGKAGELARWTLLFVLVNQVAYIVIVRLGTTIDKEAADALDFGAGFVAYASAYLVFILPHSIITVSVVTGLLPRMSRHAADGHLEDVRDDLATGWRLIALGVVAAAAAFVALGPQITGVLFATFDREQPGTSHFIGLILVAFGFGLPAFSAQYVALRGFYAQEDTRTPLLLQLVIAVTNVGLALLAYSVLPLRWRMVGIAGAYTAAYVGGLALSTAVLRRRLGGLGEHHVLRTYVRLIVAALPAGLAAWGLARLITHDLGTGLGGSMAALAAGGVVLLAGFLATARAMRIEELATLTAAVRGKIGARGGR